MNPSLPFIQRPVATWLFMAAICLSGLVAYRQLPLSALPEVDYPTIQIVTSYPGASPEVMTSSVTAPLERQFGQIPGLKQMSSVSSGGASAITLQFTLELSLDVAEQGVQAAINAAGTFLPPDLPFPPIYSKVNPADLPILTLALTAKTLPLYQLEDYADLRLAQKISQLPGVGLVSIAGGQRPAVRIRANPKALAAYGLSLEDLRIAIANANTNLAKGGFDGKTRAYTIDANDQLLTAAGFQGQVIAYRGGAPVRLGDVAEATSDAENTRLAAWADETPAILLNIQRQPGANVIEVADRVKALLPRLQEALPPAVELRILSDRTLTIRASVRSVKFELLMAIALVVMVIFVFLRSLSATLIPSLAVPISLIGTFGIMYLAGFSINNLTLMALTIATGFVVDDAIVMIENITRHIEAGESPMVAARRGAEQIGFTIISLTVSLIAVLIPLLFMGDVVGRLFREFAITLAVAILVSAVVSLTLTPMLCGRLLRHRPAAAEGRIARATARLFATVIARYGVMLTWVLRHQTATLWVAIGTLVLTVCLYIAVPKGFFPIQDTGLIQGISEAPQSVSFTAMAERQQALAREILRDPAVAGLSSFIGVDGVNSTLNSGRLLINLKPREERRESASEVIRRLQVALDVPGVAPGIGLYMQPVQDLTIEGRVSRTQYQFMVQDTDPLELAREVPRLLERLRASPLLASVASDLAEEGLQAFVEIDRDTAGRFGITPAAIDNALYSAFGQRIVSTIFTQANQYRVILEVKPEFQKGIKAIDELYVPAATGGQVPLRALVSVREQPTPLVVNHLGQFPAATISFNLAPGVALGAAVEEIQAIEAGLQWPPSLQTSFQGAAAAFTASLSNEVFLLLAAVITMYIVLGILYESYIHPITVLSTLPSAGIGALLALMAAGEDLSIVAVIGIVLLIGIVKKNAILMIDFALEAERKEGLPPREAIYQACLLRFRPILMTTLAALLSALPLMLGEGMGAELRQPLGIAMVGGLIVSQCLTLFTTPVIYLAFDRLSRRWDAFWGRPQGAGQDEGGDEDEGASLAGGGDPEGAGAGGGGSDDLCGEVGASAGAPS